MELNRHKIWNLWEEKSHKQLSKTQNQKTRLKAPQRVVKKKLLRSHIWYIYLSSGSYDLQLSSCQNIFRMKWNGDNCTIQIVILMIGWKMYHEILVTWNENIGSIVDQSIIRCNYSDKFSYWNWKNKCINESKPKCKCTKWYKNYP